MNPHRIAPTWPSTMRVYQFRHPSVIRRRLTPSRAVPAQGSLYIAKRPIRVNPAMGGYLDQIDKVDRIDFRQDRSLTIPDKD